MPEGLVPSQEQSRPLERVAEALEQRGTTAGVAAPRERMVVPLAAGAPVVERPRAVVAKSPLREDIEHALAAGLEETYAALSAERQAAFRDRGETLAAYLESAIGGGKEFPLRDAYTRVMAWLELLPSAGKFFRRFLEQEVKVKMDMLVALARRSEKLGAGS